MDKKKSINKFKTKCFQIIEKEEESAFNGLKDSVLFLTDIINPSGEIWNADS